MYCGDDVGAIVADIGALYAKFGYAGDDQPKWVEPSQVGVTTTGGDGGTDGGETRYHLGTNELAHARRGMAVRAAVDPETGLASDWDAMEQLWDHAYATLLRARMPEHPVLVCDPVVSTARHRARHLELLFERGGAPAAFFQSSAVLSAFAAGRATAMVVDSGYASTRVVPVNDGYVLQRGVRVSPVAGRLLTRELLACLERAPADTQLRQSCGRVRPLCTIRKRRKAPKPRKDDDSSSDDDDDDEDGSDGDGDARMANGGTGTGGKGGGKKNGARGRGRGKAGAKGGAKKKAKTAKGGAGAGAGAGAGGAQLPENPFDVAERDVAAMGLTPSFLAHARLEVARDLKDSTCRVWANPGAFPEKEAALYIPEPYELPDGTPLRMGVDRFRTPEMLIDPRGYFAWRNGPTGVPPPPGAAAAAAAGGSNGGAAAMAVDAGNGVRAGAGAGAAGAAEDGSGLRGLPRLVVESVEACDVDVRRALLQQVLVTGGNSLLPGLVQRMDKEVGALLSTVFKASFVTPSPLERRFSTWIGGSILASLGTFQQMWMSRAQYEEVGAAKLLERSCD